MAKNLRFYRANKTNNGFASEFQLSYKENEKYDKYMVFLSMAKQTGVNDNGDASFDWKAAIKVKLGENDIGEMLAVLTNRQNALGYNGKGLFHETPNGGNKIISLTKNDNGGYYIKVSGQDKDKQSLGVFTHGISNGESEVLFVFLQECIKKIYDL